MNNYKSEDANLILEKLKMKPKGKKESKKENEN